jgi:phosphoglycerol transferase MdoB-like AlkP superfamily enzyme
MNKLISFIRLAQVGTRVKSQAIYIPVSVPPSNKFNAIAGKVDRYSESVEEAILFFIAFFLLSSVITICNYFECQQLSFFLIPVPLRIFSLPFLMGEHLWVGIVLSFFYYNLVKWRFGKYLVRFFGTLLFLLLAFDQMAYQYFFRHLDTPLVSDARDVSLLWGSIFDSLDVSFMCSLAVAGFCSILLWKGRPRTKLSRLVAILFNKPVRSSVVLLLYIAATYLLTGTEPLGHIHRALVADLVRSVAFSSADDDDLPVPQQNAVVVLHKTASFGQGKTSKQLKSLTERIKNNRKRLNIVHYVLESSPFRQTSVFPQAEYDTTPFLKQLATESVVFTNYYNVFPGSTRGDFSTLTGLFPYIDQSSNIKKYGNSTTRLPSLPDILHRKGYKTGLFASSDTKFDSFDAFLSRLHWDTYVDTKNFPGRLRQIDGKRYWGVEEGIVIDKALEWMAQQKAQGAPFFVEYFSVFPHHPYLVPKSYKQQASKDWGTDARLARYRASLHYADSCIKKLFQGIQKLGLEDDTLFIVSPDHGEAFGKLHSENMLHAERVYDENVHIFLLLHNKRVLGKALTIPRVGNQPDFLKTVLQILHIEPPSAVQGQSLLSSDFVERQLFFVSRRQFGIRDGKYKLIVNKEDESVELYDLSSDPTEQKNIAKSFPDIVSSLKQHISDWKAAIRDQYQKIERGMDPSKVLFRISPKRE